MIEVIFYYGGASSSVTLLIPVFGNAEMIMQYMRGATIRIQDNEHLFEHETKHPAEITYRLVTNSSFDIA